MSDVDISYVREILAALPSGLSRAEFLRRTGLDLQAGYFAEVAEAERRYFDDVTVSIDRRLWEAPARRRR